MSSVCGTAAERGIKTNRLLTTLVVINIVMGLAVVAVVIGAFYFVGSLPIRPVLTNTNQTLLKAQDTLTNIDHAVRAGSEIVTDVGGRVGSASNAFRSTAVAIETVTEEDVAHAMQQVQLSAVDVSVSSLRAAEALEESARVLRKTSTIAQQTSTVSSPPPPTSNTSLGNNMTGQLSGFQ